MSPILSRNNVRESGRLGAQPILFAHGYGCDQSMWRLVTPYFEAEHRVVTFDHLGFGGSDLGAWDADRYGTLQAYADDVLQIIEELDLHDVVLVGHSVSSMISVLAANRRPDRFARLVLLCPSPRYLDDADEGYVGGFSPADIDALLHGLESNQLGWSSTMAPTMMANPDRPDLAAELEASFCRVRPDVAQSFARSTFLSDNRRDLSTVTVPTLIIQCRRDSVAPIAVGEYVHEAIAGSVLAIIDAAGHCPNLSAPRLTAETISDYLHRSA